MNDISSPLFKIFIYLHAKHTYLAYTLRIIPSLESDESMDDPSSMENEQQTHMQETETLSVEERDRLALTRSGKKSILKGFHARQEYRIHDIIDKTAQRRFSFFSMLGFTGGSAELIYSYLFSFIGSIAVFTTMGELASMLARSPRLASHPGRQRLPSRQHDHRACTTQSLSLHTGAVARDLGLLVRDAVCDISKFIRE
ncbi:MAG: hypothetical protein Q9169_008072 [Polycauliona sp. 2 TL-2023]